jgi:hypothetical protein
LEVLQLSDSRRLQPDAACRALLQYALTHGFGFRISPAAGAATMTHSGECDRQVWNIAQATA